tara:strand:- start:559 stop:981 length:423 start_codon:yes stop_codon:yes gene_type:complete
MSYFNNIKEGDKTFSTKYGMATVLSIEHKNFERIVICKAQVNGEQKTFEAVLGDLREPTWIDELPELKHCYHNYTLQDAVQMVVNNGQLHEKSLTNIEEVKSHLSESISLCWHVWTTGQIAMELITAYTENKPIREVAVV